MKYICQFPGCDYITNERSQIQNHHIVPKEHRGHDRDSNRIFLCPNCHTKVYIRDSHGVHSVKGEDSIIINKWVQSTDGLLLEYIDKDNKLQYI